MAEQEAADLSAGRVRLADDDYDYGGKRGNRKKGRRKGKSKTENNSTTQNEENDCGGTPTDLDSTIAQGNDEIVEDYTCDDDEKKIDGDASSFLPVCDDLDGVTVDGDNVEELLCNEVDVIEIASNDSINDESSEEEPDSWRCECCRKDFKSQKQFENHEKSKKHKETMKKYEQKFQKEARENALKDMMDELGE